MTEELIFYGARCTWYGDKIKATVGGGLPCCPVCGCPLFEVKKSMWENGIAKVGEKNLNYPHFMEWLKDNHFTSYKEALSKYKEATGNDALNETGQHTT